MCMQQHLDEPAAAAAAEACASLPSNSLLLLLPAPPGSVVNHGSCWGKEEEPEHAQHEDEDEEEEVAEEDGLEIFHPLHHQEEHLPGPRSVLLLQELQRTLKFGPGNIADSAWHCLQRIKASQRGQKQLQQAEQAAREELRLLASRQSSRQASWDGTAAMRADAAAPCDADDVTVAAATAEASSALASKDRPNLRRRHAAPAATSCKKPLGSSSSSSAAAFDLPPSPDSAPASSALATVARRPAFPSSPCAAKRKAPAAARPAPSPSSSRSRRSYSELWSDLAMDADAATTFTVGVTLHLLAMLLMLALWQLPFHSSPLNNSVIYMPRYSSPSSEHLPAAAAMGGTRVAPEPMHPYAAVGIASRHQRLLQSAPEAAAASGAPLMHASLASGAGSHHQPESTSSEGVPCESESASGSLPSVEAQLQAVRSEISMQQERIEECMLRMKDLTR
jgi:hypothetical protein